MPPLLRLRDITKSYLLGARTVHALRGINLTIDRSGFFAIMGPSGSGKSTLLHLLAALDRPDSGEIVIGDQHLETMTERELTMFRRKRIGIVFQQFNLIPTLDALNNVTLPAMLDGMAPDERTERGRTLLASLGLADRANHRPDALSGGEQQRVAIARALFFQPDLLLADEPTGNLDQRTGKQIGTLLRELADEHGITILMVTHEPGAAALCRTVFLLYDGCITDTFPTDGLHAAELATRAQQSLG